MSLILDALRRSENGGAAISPQPSLPEHHTGIFEKTWLGVLFFVFAGLGIAAGWMMRGDPTGPENAEQVISSESRSLSSGDAVTSLKLTRGDAAPFAPNAGPPVSTPLASATNAAAVAPTQMPVTADKVEANSERIATLHQQMWSCLLYTSDAADE